MQNVALAHLDLVSARDRTLRDSLMTCALESSPFRVLRRQALGRFVLRKLRMPSFKVLPQLSVQDACADLQERVCAALRPSHLLPLDHAFGDDLVDGRFRDPVAISSPCRRRSA